MKCSNCKICELTCSLVKEGIFNPGLSRITRTEFGMPEVSVTKVCNQCQDAPCAEACPLDAIKENESTQCLEVVEGLCIGCGKCVKACPYDAIKMNREKRIAYKCDLCGGDPSCLVSCPKEAIQLSDDEILHSKEFDDMNAQLNILLGEMGIDRENLLIKD